MGCTFRLILTVPSGNCSMTIPIMDCWHKGEHPKMQVSGFRGWGFGVLQVQKVGVLLESQLGG